MIDHLNAQLFPSLFGPGSTVAGVGIGPGTFAGAPGGLIPEGAISQAGIAASPIGGLFNGGSLLGGFSSFSNVLGIGGAILPGILSGNFGQAAAGGIGAALGTALFPGLGTLLGGAAGRLKAGIIGSHSNKRSAA